MIQHESRIPGSTNSAKSIELRLKASEAQVAVKVQVFSWDVYWLSLANRAELGLQYDAV